MGLFSRHGGPHVCPPIPSPEFDLVPLSNGWTIHHLFVVLSAAFMAAACLIAMALYMLHAMHFSNPQEQTKILRIVFFIPVFSLISFGCVLLNDNALYLAPWNNVYEAFALANFYMLLCTYVSPDAVNQQEFFNSLRVKNGQVAGFRWFNHTRRSVFQYTPVALILAVVVDVTLKTKVYCQTSNSVHFAHIWTTVLRAISVVIAAMAAISFTFRLRSVLSQKKIMQKLFALKTVIFLETIQNLVFSILRVYVKPTSKVSYVDITTGLPSLLICIELFLVSIFLHFAYTWKPYVVPSNSALKYRGGLLGIRAMLYALNPTDVIQSFASALNLSGNGNSY